MPMPEKSAAMRPTGNHFIGTGHDLHGNGAGQTNIGGQRKIDIARPERDHEHLSDPGNHRKDGQRQPGRDHSAGAVAVSEHDRREPNQESTEVGPNPWSGKNVESAGELSQRSPLGPVD